VNICCRINKCQFLLQHVWGRNKQLLITQCTCITGFNPQSPCRFAWRPSAQVLQTLRPSYLSHGDYSCCVRSQLLTSPLLVCGNMLVYPHRTWCTPTTRDINMDSLTLPVPEAGNFVELILPCILMGTQLIVQFCRTVCCVWYNWWTWWETYCMFSWRIKDQLEVTCYFISLLTYSTCFRN
jgi:hypothetical protein